MAKKSLLVRGFKSQAERISLAFRKELNLENHSPLSGFNLANHLAISIFEATHFFDDATNLDKLLGSPTNSSGWSALTMLTEKGNKIIIHNHLQAETRQQSNLMHELAHSICKHEKPTRYEEINLPFFMRDFDPKQEEEAIYLGGALQIPRDGLLWALKNGMSKEEIAEHYIASTSMVTFRINSTGVKRQLSYLR